MKSIAAVIIAVLVCVFLPGCASTRPERPVLKEQINVFGVQIASTTDYREINGVRAVEEPCLRGYERTFEALDIIIGYDFDGRVRKITTRNPATAMFGVRPGMPFAEGRSKILEAGFAESAPPFGFKEGRLSLTFLVDEKGRIFGLKLESLD